MVLTALLISGNGLSSLLGVAVLVAVPVWLGRRQLRLLWHVFILREGLRHQGLPMSQADLSPSATSNQQGELEGLAGASLDGEFDEAAHRIFVGCAEAAIEKGMDLDGEPVEHLLATAKEFEASGPDIAGSLPPPGADPLEDPAPLRRLANFAEQLALLAEIAAVKDRPGEALRLFLLACRAAGDLGRQPSAFGWDRLCRIWSILLSVPSDRLLRATEVGHAAEVEQAADGQTAEEPVWAEDLKSALEAGPIPSPWTYFPGQFVRQLEVLKAVPDCADLLIRQGADPDDVFTAFQRKRIWQRRLTVRAQAMAAYGQLMQVENPSVSPGTELIVAARAAEERARGISPVLTRLHRLTAPDFNRSIHAWIALETARRARVFEAALIAQHRMTGEWRIPESGTDTAVSAYDGKPFGFEEIEGGIRITAAVPDWFAEHAAGDPFTVRFSPES